ncbi:TPA: serine/threonine-protein phosphatase [Escherichia coli]|nr:serine/threonine-protein phosphatase [Escherichia coli]HAW6230541.1 serine/threonine-protein phosphatase [Escherichia coli]
MITLLNCGLFSVAKEIAGENEDTILAPLLTRAGYVMAVADGVGSYAGAKILSSTVINTLKELTENGEFVDVESTFIGIKSKINELVEYEPLLYKAATTLTYAILNEKGLYIGHVGDSRLYLKKARKLIQLTKDHTQYQSLMDRKLYTKKELDSMGVSHTLTLALSNSIDLGYEHIFYPINDCLDDDGFINLYLMTDGAYHFWNKRPRFSYDTLKKPTRFASSLLNRIELNGAIDDYSLVAARFSISK